MFISYIRAIILYIILILAIRLMGKRQIGELEPTEFVVAILLADLASIPMQDTSIPLLSGILPILTVLSIELILSVLSLRFRGVRKFLTGNPIMLIENGKILSHNLSKTRITIDELMQQLRRNGICDISTVQFAILEVDGQISTLLYPKHQPPTAADMHVKVENGELPMVVISDGEVLESYLAAAGRNRAWLNQQLRKLRCSERDIFLMTVTKSGRLYVSMEEKAE